MSGVATDATLDKIRERLLPATLPFRLIMLSVDERLVTTSDQAIDLAVAMDNTMLHQIRLHHMPNRCIRCNSTDWLPRRFRSSARCRACGAGRLAIDPPGEFAWLEHRWLPVDSGADPWVIQAILGHGSIATSQRYVRKGEPGWGGRLRR
jgi:hypothetical protein